MNKYIELEDWFERVKEIAISAYGYSPLDSEELDIIEFEWMFDDGFTPREAMAQFNEDNEYIDED